MFPVRGRLILVVAVLLLKLKSLRANDFSTDVQCETNECPNQEDCLKRDGPGNVTFVCECVSELRYNDVMGHDCSKRSGGLSRTFNSCYGNACRTGRFASPNYPNNYNTRDQILMTLYIPHATYIHFTFSLPFWIEKGKDALYVGKGLEVYRSDLDKNGSTFDGNIVPGNFTLDSDTAWLLFISDNSETYSGFNISWTSEVDFEAPIVTSCPPEQTLFVRQGVKHQKVTWDEPKVMSSEEYTMETNAPTDGIFLVGNSTVWYRFADVFENDVFCEFSVDVVIDDVPPVFYGCPGDLSLNVTLLTKNTSIFWVEPFATDNSNLSLIVNTTLRPGTILGEGIHEIHYVATDQFGNQGHCNFQINITILEEDEPTRPIINEVLPIVVCGALFTIISCIFCLGRAVKSGKRQESTTRSKEPNSSSEKRSSSSRARARKKEDSLSSSSSVTRGMTSSNSERRISTSSSSSGFISDSFSHNMSTIDEESNVPTEIANTEIP